LLNIRNDAPSFSGAAALSATRHRIFRALVTGVLALALYACGPVGGTLQVSVREYATFDHTGLTLTLTDPRRTQVLHGSDFAVRNQPSPRIAESHSLRVPDAGSLQGEFTLESSTGQVIAAGSFDIELYPGWRWNLGFYPGKGDPAASCFGCAGSVGFEISPEYRAAAGDSLWVVWGGGPRQGGIVY
jgi:hypothetical protein